MKTKAVTVGAFEAKNRFSDLLKQVGRGAEFTITKHDKPLARLLPAGTQAAEQRKQAAAGLRAMREHYSLKGLSVSDLIAGGRK